MLRSDFFDLWPPVLCLLFFLFLLPPLSHILGHLSPPQTLPYTHSLSLYSLTLPDRFSDPLTILVFTPFPQPLSFFFLFLFSHLPPSPAPLYCYSSSPSYYTGPPPLLLPTLLPPSLPTPPLCPILPWFPLFFHLLEGACFWGAPHT